MRRLDRPLVFLLPATLCGAWVLVALAVGAVGRSLPLAMLKGLLALGDATFVYYGMTRLTGSRPSSAAVAHAGLIWTAVALAVGPIVGAGGYAWRRGGPIVRVASVSLVAASWIVAGILVQDGLPNDVPARLFPGTAVLLGMGLPLQLMRRARVRTLAWAGSLALAVAGVSLGATAPALIRHSAAR